MKSNIVEEGDGIRVFVNNVYYFKEERKNM